MMANDGVHDVLDYYARVAPFLDAELANRGDATYWSEVGRMADHILEIGAGTGRVTSLLGQAGARVVGIDVSPPMLARAAQRLVGAPRIALVRADVRQMPVREAFDAVVAANDPFCHLLGDAERTGALRAVARCLRPNGRFILDALWLSEAERAGEDGRTGPRGVSHTGTWRGNSLVVDEQWRREPFHDVGHGLSGPVCSVRYTYTFAGGRSTAEFWARYWTPGEIRERFDDVGLTIDHTWGTFDRAPWDPRRSTHLIVEARRS